MWLGVGGAGSRRMLLNATWLVLAAEAVVSAVALAHELGPDIATLQDALSRPPAQLLPCTREARAVRPIVG
jgi:3-hydroxyisobutyrate dehydrogenase-like beta-hydroxyacid dehydrogenase